jgi:uncharacterized protein (TIGR03067 family)
MNLRTFAAATLTVLLAGAQGDVQRKSDDRQLLQGTWSARSIEFHERPVLGDPIQDVQLVVKGDKIVLKGEGPGLEKYAEFTLKLDATRTPKTIDIAVTMGEEKGAVLPGIYELKGDEWRMCVAVFGKDRPKEFKSTVDSQTALAVFKRKPR